MTAATTLFLLALLGCGDDADPTGSATSPSPSPTATTTDPTRPGPGPGTRIHPELLGDIRTDQLGAVDLPHPVEEGRVRRRMDIDQLNASLRQVTNGIGWEINGVDQIEDLDRTLGRPDYEASTHEDLEPGLLFQKFLDDAANDVCEELVARESVGEPDNVYLVHATLADTSGSRPEAIEENLRSALLRFHGHAFPSGAPQLEPWRFLFDTTVDVTGGDTYAGWRSVCIALVTHPDFTLY